MPRCRRAACLAFALIAAACAARPDPAPPGAGDPLEPLNRAALGVTYAADVLVLRPAAEAYQVLLPPEVRAGLRNALGNLRSPAILLSNLAQGDAPAAGTTLLRFAVNTVFGLGGVVDVAAAMGLPGRQEDFGQTLALAGVGEGPYLFVPLLGPSNPRDLAGFAVDSATNPLVWVGGAGWQAASDVQGALTVLDTREALIMPGEAMMALPMDPYVAIREIYRARRAAMIANRVSPPLAAQGTGFAVGMGLDPQAMAGGH